MKKLIVTTMAVLLGIAANSATVNWGVSNVKSSPNATVAAGWYVQIFNSNVTYDYAKAVANTLSVWSTGTTAASASGTSFNAKGTGTQTDDTTVGYYMVIYDNAKIDNANYYIISSVKSVTINAAGSSASASFGNMTGTDVTNMFNNSSWVAVPEPTSGLLMLLGMAGLALRRKIA